MVVLVNYKNEEDPINNKGARVVTTLFIEFSDAEGQLILVVGNRILTRVKLIQAIMVVLDICKNEDDPSKMKALEWSQISPIINLWEFYQTLKCSLLHIPRSDLAEF